MSYDPRSFPGVVDARAALLLPVDLSERDYEAWCAARLAKVGRAVTRSSITLRARVDHGRWLADCPCGDAILCVPGWDRACCLLCGVSHLISFPPADAIEEAVRVLSLRPVSLRNWVPFTEPVEALVAENLAHGLPA